MRKAESIPARGDPPTSSGLCEWPLLFMFNFIPFPLFPFPTFPLFPRGRPAGHFFLHTLLAGRPPPDSIKKSLKQKSGKVGNGEMENEVNENDENKGF